LAFLQTKVQDGETGKRKSKFIRHISYIGDDFSITAMWLNHRDYMDEREKEREREGERRERGM